MIVVCCFRFIANKSVVENEVKDMLFFADVANGSLRSVYIGTAFQLFVIRDQSLMDVRIFFLVLCLNSVFAPFVLLPCI